MSLIKGVTVNLVSINQERPNNKHHLWNDLFNDLTFEQKFFQAAKPVV